MLKTTEIKEEKVNCGYLQDGEVKVIVDRLMRASMEIENEAQNVLECEDSDFRNFLYSIRNSIDEAEELFNLLTS